jgi:hypothetical protein
LDAAISCPVLHQTPHAHIDAWLAAAETAAQQEEQPELVDELHSSEDKHAAATAAHTASGFSVQQPVLLDGAWPALVSFLALLLG